MNRPLTGSPDVDREILLFLPDEDLFEFCRQKNKYIRRLCNDEDLWRARFLQSPLAPLLAPGLTDPIEILTEIQRYGRPDITTWRKLYYYVYGIKTNMGMAFLNSLDQPDERLVELIKHFKEIKHNDFRARYPLGENGKITQDSMAELRHKRSKIVKLKPDLLAFLIENILPMYQTHAFGNDLNGFILFSHGFTKLDVLYMIILRYMEYHNVSDEYYLSLYDDDGEMLILEDAVVPENELRPAEIEYMQNEGVARVEQEGQLLLGADRALSNEMRIAGQPTKDHLKF